MLSFFNKSKNNPQKQGEDSTVSSQELLNEEAQTQDEEIRTVLSIHPSMNISTEQQYVLRFLNNELPALKPNQISLSGIELHQENGKAVIAAFVRNSLSKGVTFKKTPLLLLGPDEKVLGRKEFDLSELDELPPESSRPWNFVFEPSDLYTTDIPKEGWKLAFDLKKDVPHRLDLEQSWETTMSDSDRAKLQELVQKIDPPKPGEVNFFGLQAKLTDNQDLHVTLLIRNGNDKNIKIQHLPLQVKDASDEIVATGGFSFDNLEVKGNSSKPWTFIFPTSLVEKKQPDLSRWKAYPLQKK
jgi:accessory Sec system S-layer assembly protein